MSQNNEKKNFSDSALFQILIFGGAVAVWFFVKKIFGITDEEHFGFIGSVAITFVIALVMAMLMGALMGLLEPHKEKIQKAILVGIIAFAIYIIGSVIVNKNTDNSNNTSNISTSQ